MDITTLMQIEDSCILSDYRFSLLIEKIQSNRKSKKHYTKKRKK